MTGRIFAIPVILLSLSSAVLAASAHSPRHSGMEPPDAPGRRGDSMAGRPLSRTPSGGMGYTDAYGNPVEDTGIEEKKKSDRPKPEWMRKSESVPGLPDPGSAIQSPLWKFQ